MLTQPRSATLSISKCSPIAEFTTMVGTRARRHPCRHGSWERKSSPRSTTTSGNSTTSLTTFRRTMISRPKIRKNCGSYRRCSLRRRRSTKSCRWTTRCYPASSRRGRVRRPAEPFSHFLVRTPAFRTVALRASSTRITRSLPRLPFHQVAPRE